MYEILCKFLYDISEGCIELLKVYEIFAEGLMRWQMLNVDLMLLIPILILIIYS